MKRLILYLVVTLLTFAFGVGLDQLGWRRPVKKAPAEKTELVSLSITKPQPQVASIVPAAAVQAPAVTPKPNFILDYDPEEFAPYAVFYPMGPLPKGFAKFDSLEVAVGRNEVGPGSISVNTRWNDYGNYDSAPAIFALVTETRLFFATSQNRSRVEYRFDGQFLRKDFNSVAGEDKAVLRGTLTKTKNGQKIAECIVSFRMEHLGC